MFLGLDIGSSSSKAVILDESGTILARQVVNLGTGTKGILQVLEAVFAESQVCQADILYTVVTGYGRMNYPNADRQITEISCHAKGVRYINPLAQTIIDIGGQDSKVIRLSVDGGIENFVMNDKCAAGTGRFLEVMSRVLDCPLGALSDLAQAGTAPVSISSMCTVFAESEVISHLSTNARLEDVAAGALQSIATRVAGMAKRVGVVPALVMTGGGAMNACLVSFLENALDVSISVAPQPQTMGALGAAVFAREHYHKLKTKGVQ